MRAFVPQCRLVGRSSLRCRGNVEGLRGCVPVGFITGQPDATARGPAVMRLLVLALTALALHPSAAAIQPLPASVKAQLTTGKVWRPVCPVRLSQLRLLTVPYWGFDGREHTGQLVVHEDAAVSLRRVLLRLHRLHFPIHHMQIDEMYGPRYPAD